MGYTNSSLVDVIQISPNQSGPRTHKIDTVTIHCTAGQTTARALGQWFANANRRASSNYGIGYDGSIGLYVEEKDRSWCSSSSANDNRAITIEVSSDNYHPYKITSVAYKALIDLLVDICERNGIEKLLWRGDKSLIGQVDKQNMTVHRWFAEKTCIPVDSEVLTRHGWVPLSQIHIGDEVACANINALEVSFAPVYDMVEPHMQDTYTNNGLTATKDHRMVYCTHQTGVWKIEDYAHLLRDKRQIYIPMAGHSNYGGLPFSNDMLAFLCAVQADGHYMYERRVDQTLSYYGVEFHLKKQRKIDRLCALLDSIQLSYSTACRSDGTTAIRVYNQNGCNIVSDICEQFLSDKKFNWRWLDLSPEQAAFFLDEILFWDGCQTASLYCSSEAINIDVVSAIAAINGVGSHVFDNTIQFRQTPYMTLSHDNTTRNNRARTHVPVACVSVPTGIFLIRQHGKTFIVGNCPGDYLYNLHPQIAAEVNARLEDEEVNIDKFIEEASDEQLISLFNKMNTALAKRELPTNWNARGELDEAVAMGITDGSRPMAVSMRYEDAIMIKRAAKK